MTLYQRLPRKEENKREVQDFPAAIQENPGGIPRYLDIPQDWGIKGVEIDFINTLRTDSYYIR